MLKPKILIVDDDVMFLQTLDMILTRLGCETFFANDGVQALAVLSKHSVSMIISDIQMPRMDGVELLEAVNHKGLEIPFVVMTGHSDYSEQEIDGLNGVTLMRKPFRSQQIREIIEEYLPLVAD